MNTKMTIISFITLFRMTLVHVKRTLDANLPYFYFSTSEKNRGKIQKKYLYDEQNKKILLSLFY